MSTFTTFAPRAYQRREHTLGSWPVGVASYQLGQRWHCDVDNGDPGARIATGWGETREEAENVAFGKAEERLGRTRILRAG